MGLRWSSGRRTDQSTSAHDFLPPSHTPTELHCHRSSNRSRWPGQAAIASIACTRKSTRCEVYNECGEQCKNCKVRELRRLHKQQTTSLRRTPSTSTNPTRGNPSKPRLYCGQGPHRSPEEPCKETLELARRSKTEARQEEQHAQAC